MNRLHIHSLDLNLLRVFDVLLEERSVTRAGARLGLSQSAVSHALNRLRYVLNDEVFVRGPHGMAPTPRAVELGPQVHSALSQLQAAFAPPAFDPATTERRFAVVAGAYACAVLVPSLVARMADEAPKAELVVAEAAVDVLEQLDARRADFVIGVVAAAPPRLTHETLLTESLVWVVRAQNPQAQGQIGMEELMSLPHVVISGQTPSPGDPNRSGLSLHASWEDYGAFDAALAVSNLTRRVGVVLPDSYSALAVVSRSDMVALVPRRLATLSVQRGFVRMIEPPYDTRPVDLSLLLLKERLAEPAIAWMQALLHDVAASV
jgi:DNA-binding transcriptional LysR family regulator